MSALLTLAAAGAFAFLMILGVVHLVTVLVQHEHVPGPPTGRCVRCGCSIEHGTAGEVSI